MRISHRYRFIFFANPKTGSSSLRQFLDPYSDVRPAENYRLRTPDNPFYPHITPREAKPLIEERGWDFECYTKFVVVRNPWARLVSLYTHVQQDRGGQGRFHEWLETVEPSGKGGGGEDWERWRRYGAYSIEHFIKDEEGRVLVDKVLRLEDLDTTLRPFLTSLGLPVESARLRHSNQRVIRDYRSYYTPETAALVRQRYAHDVETYGYDFASGPPSPGSSS